MPLTLNLKNSGSRMNVHQKRNQIFQLVKPQLFLFIILDSFVFTLLHEIICYYYYMGWANKCIVIN